MNQYWAKMPLQLLERSVYRDLGDRLISLSLFIFLAASRDKDRKLPDPENLAYLLHIESDELLNALFSLSDAGLVEETYPGCWRWLGFDALFKPTMDPEHADEWLCLKQESEKAARSSAERVRRYRAAQREKSETNAAQARTEGVFAPESDLVPDFPNKMVPPDPSYVEEFLPGELYDEEYARGDEGELWETGGMEQTDENGSKDLPSGPAVFFPSAPEPAVKTADSPKMKGYGVNGLVLLSDWEYHDLLKRFPNDLTQRIEDLSLYIGSTGKKYTSHYMTLIRWDRIEKKAPAFRPVPQRREKEKDFFTMAKELTEAGIP